MSVIPVTDLTSTLLYGRLSELTRDNLDSALATNVRQLCAEAADRLRVFPAVHAQYTLHDEVHSLRVVTLMGELLGQTVHSLNTVEIALLILSAYYHDQGMIVDADELAAIRKSDAWHLHEAQWAADHPNRTELLGHLADPLLGDAQREQAALAIADLHAAMFTAFIRPRHGERSAAFVRARLGQDPRLITNGRSIADLLARLCESHVLPPAAITSASGFRIDELVGTRKINLAFLAYVLRLADILDFDRDRTPDSLYRAISFTSGVSLVEWEKHRSIIGWEISPTRIIIAAECVHPAYERAVRQFLSWVEEELRAAREWGRLLPSDAAQYELKLPATVDTSRIGPRPDPKTGKPAYIYLDLEFTLSRDELVKLLMTSELYGSSGLFVRELLQNALDALRHRRALFLAAGVSPPSLEVSFEHFQDAAGFDVVRCVDSGVGMDTAIVSSFLTRAGRSYYRSPEFEQERAQFQRAGCDFDPCARFGIGFMSCFMFGDEITIKTRRDYGIGRNYGEPLEIQVTGLSGIVMIRPGAPDQPVGTTVEVRGRRKAFVVDEWDDPVLLLDIVRGYALATEFPITAKCLIPAISGNVVVPATFSARPHPLEEVPITQKQVFSVDLSTIDENLRGELRVCTLVDDDGLITLSNREAFLSRRQEENQRTNTSVIVTLADGSTSEIGRHNERSQVCADGILVAGEPGREKYIRRLGSYSSPITFGNVSALIDTRGELKPALSPARTPPARTFGLDGSWRRLAARVGRGYGLLLEELLEKCNPHQDPLRFWLAVEAYNLRLALLPLSTAWNRLQVPVQREPGIIEWCPLHSIGQTRLVYSADPMTDQDWRSTVVLDGGGELAVPPEVEAFRRGGERPGSAHILEHLVIAVSVNRVISATELLLTPVPPLGDGTSLDDLRFGDCGSMVNLARFADPTVRLLRVVGQNGLANIDHPVTSRVRATQYVPREERSPLDEFLATLMWDWPRLHAERTAAQKSRAARACARLGRMFHAIDWTNAPDNLQPPYTVLVPGAGLQSITISDLRDWNSVDQRPAQL